MGDEFGEETLLDVLGDPETRSVLEAIDSEPRSARALSENLGYSRPTVYRRVNRLQDLDLVETRSRVRNDGHHYREYRSVFGEVTVSLDREGFTVELTREVAPADSSSG